MREEWFRLTYCATVALVSVLHLVTIVVFVRDVKLRAGGGSVFIIYLILLLTRMAFSVAMLDGKNVFVFFPFMFCECTSVSCQVTMSHRIWKTFTCDRVNSVNSRCDGFFCMFLTIVCYGALYMVFWALLIHLFLPVLPWYCVEDVKLNWLSSLPLVALNTPMSLVTAWRIYRLRSERKSLETLETRRHSGPDINWSTLILKVAFICGVQTDLLWITMWLVELVERDDTRRHLIYVLYHLFLLRGLEIFFVFVCKKKVWDRLSSKT